MTIRTSIKRRRRRRPLVSQRASLEDGELEELDPFVGRQRELAAVRSLSLPARRRRDLFARTLIAVVTLIALLVAANLPPVASLSYAQQQQQQQQQQQYQSISGLQQSMAQLLQVFNGNDSATSSTQTTTTIDNNHFRLFERYGDYILVGARNVVYNLSLNSMREQRRLEWPSSEDDIKMCRVKGKSSEQCQNHIRVIKLQSPDTLFVCGTNAYKPQCRNYTITSNAYVLSSEGPGEGACPYQENQNVTSLFAEGELYSATAAQFSGIDGLIHRHPLRTEQFNPKQLNSPNFVSSFRYGDHVYFLFRESAIEHINCGKTIYSRIARVCLNDSGGSTRANRERWTSFVKARLNCSIPGEYPFYFDEIQASTHIVTSLNSFTGSPQGGATSATSGNPPIVGGSNNPAIDLIYAVFTTPTNSIGGSAVCAFRMADVLAAFDGPFKSQADSNSNWLPVPESKVPQPRPGTCVNDSKRLPDENINFIKDNPLMDTAIEAVWSQPLVMMASINFRFTSIAVDAQVETQSAPGASSMRTDVIFVSTDDGRVFKLINTQHLYAAAAAATASAQPYSNRQQQQMVGPQSPYYMASTSSAARTAAPVYGDFGGYHSSSSLLSGRPVAAGLMSSPGTQSTVTREPLPDVSSNTIVVEELHLFDARTPILNMLIYYPPIPIYSSQQHPTLVPNYATPMNIEQQQPFTGLGGQYPKLVVMAGRQMKAVPLARCERALSCFDCLALYDPYCAWDIRQQACLAVGHSTNVVGYAHSAQRYGQMGSSSSWFPPNNMPTNNHTLAWWMQCTSADSMQSAMSHNIQQVGAPFRSLFSSHLQVPSRFDYASGHHLSHTTLVSLPVMNNPGGQQQQQQQQQTAAASYHRQQPVSECLTFCGGLYPAQTAGSGLTTGTTAGAESGGLMMNCADYVQQHYIGNFPATFMGGVGTTSSGGANHLQANGNLYTSENLYLAVIICAASGLILGLLFGFAIGRNTRKHDSSICSSTFDETNLYMASTGSHHGANLFAHQPLHQRLQHPLLQQSGIGNGLGTAGLLATTTTNGPNGLTRQHLFEATGLLHNSDTGNYGNMHLSGNNHSNHNNPASLTNTNTNGPIRSGALPPLPLSQPPLVSTNNATTHIQHAQLTPNSINSSINHQNVGGLSTSSASSTNTSSTSATVPASDHHTANQLYLNQQQLMAQPPYHHQRTFTNGSNNSSQGKGSGRIGMDSTNGKLSVGVKTPQTFLQQQQQTLQQQQQNNKIYL